MSTISSRYFGRLTDEQLAAVQHLRVFASPFRLIAEDPGRYASQTAFAELGCMRYGSGFGRSDPSFSCRKGPFPRTLTITIRHVDWKAWGVGYRISPHFSLECMLGNHHWENIFGGLKVLRMELETEEVEKEQLIPLVKRLQEYDFDIGNGELLIAEQDVQEWTWKGMVKRGPFDPKWDEKTFYVVAIVWRVKKSSDNYRDKGTSDSFWA